MYKKIAKHPGTRKLYADKLAAQGLGDTLGDDMVKALARRDGRRQAHGRPGAHQFQEQVRGRLERPSSTRSGPTPADTAIPTAEWKRLAERITTVPAGFTVHPLVKKVLDDRAAMGRGEANVDWGMGEHMAFASLVASGYPVRLSGEDCGRGTFTHRHAVLHDQNREKFDEGTYVPLQTWPTTRRRSW